MSGLMKRHIIGVDVELTGYAYTNGAHCDRIGCQNIAHYLFEFVDDPDKFFLVCDEHMRSMDVTDRRETNNT